MPEKKTIGRCQNYSFCALRLAELTFLKEERLWLCPKCVRACKRAYKREEIRRNLAKPVEPAQET